MGTVPPGPVTADQVAPEGAYSKGAQLAWALYECARNPFYVLINIYVFSAFFANQVVSDPVWGQALWGYILASAAICIAVTAPLLGTIADAGGRRKPFLLACVVLAVPSCAVLGLAQPQMSEGLWLIVLALVLTNVCYELSSIFYNALLPQVAPAKRFGSVSGLAYALANGAGVVLFSAYLLANWLYGGDGSSFLIERITPVVVALWWLVFTIPLLLKVSDPMGERQPLGSLVRQGLGRLRYSISRLRKMPNVLRYLVARMVFNEGFIILMMFMGVVGAGVLGWSGVQLSVMGLVLSFVAVGGSLFGGFLDDRFGSKAALQISILGCVAANLLLVTIAPDTVLFMATDPDLAGGLYPRAADKAFFFTEGLAAFFVTSGLVSSRAMLAKIAPRESLNELFGIYALSGTATSFAGPLAIAVMTQLLASQRGGLTAGLVFLLGGLFLLRRVER